MREFFITVECFPADPEQRSLKTYKCKDYKFFAGDPRSARSKASKFIKLAMAESFPDLKPFKTRTIQILEL